MVLQATAEAAHTLARATTEAILHQAAPATTGAHLHPEADIAEVVLQAAEDNTNIKTIRS